MGYDPSRPWQQKWRDVISGVDALEVTYQQSDLDSEAVRRQVETLFKDCRDLADWLLHQAGKPNAMDEVHTDPALKLCDGVVQTTKHHTRDRGSDPITAKISKAHGGQGGVRVTIEWSAPSGTAGCDDALDLAQRCKAAWLQFFQRENLTPW
jgi:hypothetical protein